MKAFKHKHSTKENPVWGKPYSYGFTIVDRIDIWFDNEENLMKQLMETLPKSDQYEIVDISIVVQ